jgi:membrane associated rhomboid family serine protease
MFPLRVYIRRLHLPLVTGLIIAANALVFIHELALPKPLLNEFIAHYGLVPHRYLVGLTEAPARLDLWLVPLFASMFIHGGWLHIGGNMLYLWVFGSVLEGRMGRVRFLVFYLLAGVIAAHAQVLMAPASDVPMIGASGAISGIMGGFLLLFPLARVRMLILIVVIPLFFEIPAILFLGIWFLQQFLYGTSLALSHAAAESSGIAVFAHVGGFLFGLLVISWFLGEKQRAVVRAHYRHPLAQWHGDQR